MAIPAPVRLLDEDVRRSTGSAALRQAAAIIPGVEGRTSRASPAPSCSCGWCFWTLPPIPTRPVSAWRYHQPAAEADTRRPTSAAPRHLSAVGQWFFGSGNIESVALPNAVTGATVLVVALIFTRANLPGDSPCRRRQCPAEPQPYRRTAAAPTPLRLRTGSTAVL